MKSLVTTIALLGLLGASALDAVAQTPAAIPPGTTVVFVSPQRVAAESSDGKVQMARLQELQQQRAADLRTRQQAIETLQRQVLAATDPAERQTLIQRQQSEQAGLERAAAQTQADLQAMQRRVYGDLQVLVKAALDEMLKGTSVKLVLSTETAVVWGDTSLDLTGPLIQRMNARAAATAKP